MIEKSFPRICISSTQGGGGKTLLSLGLTRAFSQNGINVKPLKKGPDYIDALWLSRAANSPVTNLDPFFLSPDELKLLFCKSMLNMESPHEIPSLAIIEGNRGLYDGLNETGQCSTAHVARTIKCPIILCLDCVKATRTIAAIINGLINFETGLIFAGIILNRVGSLRHEQSLKAAIEANCSLPVLGAIPRLELNPIPERHMGLAAHSLHASEECEIILNKLAGTVEENCNLDAIYKAACEAPTLSCPEICPTVTKPLHDQPVIGIVKDQALWFYYEENIEALKNAGCKILHLSLFDLSNENCEAWNRIDGLYLGGGFPEDFGEAISNSIFMPKIADFIKMNMPVYAECGGMMLLGKSMEYKGKKWQMANILDCDFIWDKKPRGLGYTTGEIIRTNPWYEIKSVIRGHEFHYSWCRWHSAPPTVLKLERGTGVYKINHTNYDGICINNLWASYAHIFAPALPSWANKFVLLAADFKKNYHYKREKAY